MAELLGKQPRILETKSASSRDFFQRACQLSCQPLDNPCIGQPATTAAGQVNFVRSELFLMLRIQWNRQRAEMLVKRRHFFKYC